MFSSKVVSKQKTDKRVLVVDDEPSSLKLISELIGRPQIVIEVANGGEKALELMKKNTFDLIIVDWVMPGLNGRETLLEMDDLMRVVGSKIPFVLCTGVCASRVKLPSTENLTLFDFWDKTGGVGNWFKQSQLVVELLLKENV